MTTIWCSKCGMLTGKGDILCNSCTRIQEKEYKEKYEEPKAVPGVRCCACGSVEDVVLRWVYKGGDGYQWTPDCRCKPDCFKRQDEAMGLEHKPIVACVLG